MLLYRCLHVARVTHKKQKKEISEIFNLYDRYFPLVRINPISDSDRIRSISKKKKKESRRKKKHRQLRVVEKQRGNDYVNKILVKAKGLKLSRESNAKQFDLIPFDRIMRMHTYEKYRVARGKLLSKPNTENRSQTRGADSIGAFVHPIIGFLIRSHCMNYTLYRRAARKLMLRLTTRHRKI